MGCLPLVLPGRIRRAKIATMVSITTQIKPFSITMANLLRNFIKEPKRLNFDIAE